MSIYEIRHKPRKRFGQHFLENGRIADRIIESAGLTADDTVLEIGPGRGILTSRLLATVKHVIAVEIDRDLAAALEKVYGDNPAFQLIEQDILDADLPSLIGETDGRIKVVANIPYNITSPIIELLIKNREHIAEAVLMMQREVAGRLASPEGSKEYGLLSINAALCVRTEKLFDVKPESFVPPPKVMSTVVRLSLSRELLFTIEDESLFYAVTGSVFRQRRKMMRNTLPRYLTSIGLDGDIAPGLMAHAGFEGTQRPETIDVATFVRLSNEISRLVQCQREASQ